MSGTTAEASDSYQRRVLVVEDEEFTRSLVTDGLAKAGFDVVSSASVADALEKLEECDPHVLVTDLDFGSGPTGVDLIARVTEDWPWVGIVVLTSHRAVELAVGGSAVLPDSVVYVVKSSIQSMSDIRDAVESTLNAGVVLTSGNGDGVDGQVIVTSMQAEALKLIAEGLSNAGIAKRRGTSLRSAEALVQRTLQALRIPHDPDINPRVVAVRMWQQGKVVVH